MLRVFGYRLQIEGVGLLVSILGFRVKGLGRVYGMEFRV